jgi:hypothetical protein
MLAKTAQDLERLLQLREGQGRVYHELRAAAVGPSPPADVDARLAAASARMQEFDQGLDILLKRKEEYKRALTVRCYGCGGFSGWGRVAGVVATA